MRLIYGNGYFTICAADGDSNLGPVQPARGTPEPMDLVNGKHVLVPDWLPLIAKCAPGIRQITTRTLEVAINASASNKRALTFQD